MIRCLLRGILVMSATFASNAAAEVTVVNELPLETRNAHYASNRPPLEPSRLVKLPIGAIEPHGWLATQLELMRDGYVGQLHRISRFLAEENNAWLSADGTGDHPWEELPYWLKGYGDLAYVLGDDAMITRATRWIEGTLSSQREDGFFGPRANLDRLDGKPDLWPNMIMLDALESYHEFTGDERVLDLMTNYSRWLLTIPEEDFLVPFWQKHRAADNLNTVYWLYNRTGDDFLLEVADKLHRNTANWTEEVANWHGVNISQAFRGPATYWVKARDPKFLAATEQRYQEVISRYGQVPGGMFGADEVARPGYTGPRQAAETCTMVEFMLSFEELLKYTGDLKWADRCEEVAFNDLPAATTADHKALRYLTAPNHPMSDSKSKAPGILNSGPMYQMNGHIHRCCQHNSGHGWPYFAEHLWLATPDNGLAAALYAPSKVTAKVADGVEATVVSRTDYPFREELELQVDVPRPVEFPLYLRVPQWADQVLVTIDGRTQTVDNASQKFVRINRRWTGRTTVTVAFPMSLRIDRWDRNHGSVSITRGPLTYALQIDEHYERTGGTDEFPAHDILPGSDWNYGLVLDERDPTAGIEVIEADGPLPAQPFVADNPPIRLRVKGRQIPQWTLDENNLVNQLQASPARTTEPVEPLTLIPMGGARLRISAFPTVSTKWNSYEWTKPVQAKPANASHVWSGDTTAALSDQKIPTDSNDTSIPRFTWWDHEGTTEWVEYTFETPRTVDETAVYWFDDRPGGGCRVPASWRLLYDDNGTLKPVETGDEYGVARDRFNLVTFKPVTTTRLRLEAELHADASAGILEWQVTGPADPGAGAGEYPIRPVPFTAVNITDDFWQPRLEQALETTIPYTFQRCEDTGRIANLARAGGLEEGGFVGLRYNDSDVFKVMEGAAYALALRDDPELDRYLDDLITKVAAAQEDDGYLLTIRTLEPENPPDRIGDARWSHLAHSHELYNVGHLYEAAAAHYQATGKRTLLDVALKNAELIATEFGPHARHDVPGHQEIEIGLAKLYRLTNDRRFLDLAYFFLDQRGRQDQRDELYGPYAQDHEPVTLQAFPVGHAVRAAYMYCGMADVAALTGNQAFIRAIDRIWENMVSRRMYITGGIGARHGGESFGEDYELPNASAYAETCAAIGNALWNHRMFMLHGDARYADVLERVLYNGFLAGVSFSGDRFFYVNPLMAHRDHRRQPWYGTACCPTNVARFLPSMPGFLYGVTDDAVYVNLFAASDSRLSLGDQEVTIKQETRYPWNGRIALTVTPDQPREFTLCVRIPGWARGLPVPSDLYRYESPRASDVTLTVNGQPVPIELDQGYAKLTRTWERDTVVLDIEMPIRRVRSHPEIADNQDRVALERGPLVYCVEGADFDGFVRNLVLPDDVELAAEFRSDLLNGVTVLTGTAQAVQRVDGRNETQRVNLTAVPYYAWNHRAPGEMSVWLARTPAAAEDPPVKTLAAAAEPSASYVDNSLAALNDGYQPKNAQDHGIPRFTWWDHRGTSEWVQYTFDTPQSLSSSKIYWFDDRPGGGCRLPADWQLFFHDGTTWRPVKLRQVEHETPQLDAPTAAEFEPVTTTALRLVVELQPDYSGGILEWQVD